MSKQKLHKTCERGKVEHKVEIQEGGLEALKELSNSCGRAGVLVAKRWFEVYSHVGLARDAQEERLAREKGPAEPDSPNLTQY